MSNLAYRFRTTTGLSKSYSLERLREKSQDGSVTKATECTPDDGTTWFRLEALIMSAGESASIQDQTQSDSTKTSLNTQDGTLAMSSSASSSQETENSRRKLKRVTKGSRDSRYARLSEDRRRQKRDVAPKSVEDFEGLHLGGGRYQILSQLGKGSMAYVFRARDSRLETDVVVKIPKPEKLEGEEVRERFQKESQLLVRLAHPNVVKVLDVGEYDRVPYVVMQLLSGGTLLDKMDDRVGRLRRMKPEFLKTWLREVARALDYCAKQGTVHRDVKPANILFDVDGNGFIADFGLTKIMFGEHTSLNSSETTTGIVLGTPNYIAPEVVLGKPYDGRADQYSLGITVYHALMGRPPMQGPSATVTMINQTQKRLQLLSEISSDIPKELALAVRKCIEKDPDDRFASCEEFAEAVIDGLRANSASSTSLPEVTPATARKVENPPAFAIESAASSQQREIRRKRKPRSKSSRSSSSMRSTPEALPNWNDDDWLLDDSSASSLPERRSKKNKSANRKKKADSLLVAGVNVPRKPLVAAIAVISFVMLGLVCLLWEADSPGRFHVAESGPASADQTRQSQPSATKPNERSSVPPKSPRDDDAPATALSNSSATPPRKSSDKKTSSVKVANKPAVKQISATKVVAPQSPNDDHVAAIPARRDDHVTTGSSRSPYVVIGKRVWSKKESQFIGTLKGSYPADAATALSPDGSFFAASSKPRHTSNNAVSVWETRTGRKMFTTPASPDRGVDLLMLGPETLLIADRNSHSIERWTCTGSSRKTASLRIPKSRFQPNNTTLSSDGLFLATVVESRMTVWSTTTGQLAATMDNPAVSPIKGRSSMLGQGIEKKWRPSLDASDVFESLNAVRFSPDNQSLSAVARNFGGRIMCWNNTGNIVADHVAPTERSQLNGTQRQSHIEWFNDDKNWLVGHQIFDRASGRVVVAARADASSIHCYDDKHLSGFDDQQAAGISIARIPFAEVRRSLKSLADPDQKALFSPRTQVALEMHLQPLFEPSSSEASQLKEALVAAVRREGIKITGDAGTKFILRFASGKAATPIHKRFSHQPVVETSTASKDDRFLVLELKLSGETTPVWRSRVAAINRDGNSAPDVEFLSDQIHMQTVPYFLPRNPKQVGLPVVLF